MQIYAFPLQKQLFSFSQHNTGTKSRGDAPEKFNCNKQVFVEISVEMATVIRFCVFMILILPVRKWP